VSGTILPLGRRRDVPRPPVPEAGSASLVSGSAARRLPTGDPDDRVEARTVQSVAQFYDKASTFRRTPWQKPGNTLVGTGEGQWILFNLGSSATLTSAKIAWHKGVSGPVSSTFKPAPMRQPGPRYSAEPAVEAPITLGILQRQRFGGELCAHCRLWEFREACGTVSRRWSFTEFRGRVIRLLRLLSLLRLR